MNAARGRVTAARVRGGRTHLDVTLHSGETRSRVELLQPYGMTAVPAIGSEVLVCPIGTRSHLVALLADSPALRVLDCGPGEIGIRDGQGQQVVFRADGIEVSGALKVTITSAGPVVVDAPAIRLGSAGATQAVRLASGAAATKVFAE